MSIFQTIGSLLKDASSIIPVPGLKEIGDVLVGTQTTPEQELALNKQVQDGFMQVFEAEIADRANARAREIAMARAGVRDNTNKILAYGTTAGFFLCLAMLAFVPVQPTAHDILIAMTGSLGGAWLTVMGYYFGTSSGSRDNQQTLRTIASAK